MSALAISAQYSSTIPAKNLGIVDILWNNEISRLREMSP